MAHPQDHGFCSNGSVRLALVLIGVCLVGYTIRQSLYWLLKEKSPCPSCPCACPKDFALIPIGEIHFSLYWLLKEKSPCPSCPCACPKDFALIPIDIINSSFSGCGKHEPEMRVEMEKDIIALMSEELSLQKTVANENLQGSDALLASVRRVSSHYQKEAEICTAGMETCEEPRERAEAQLAEELRAFISMAETNSDTWVR